MEFNEARTRADFTISQSIKRPQKRDDPLFMCDVYKRKQRKKRFPEESRRKVHICPHADTRLSRSIRIREELFPRDAARALSKRRLRENFIVRHIRLKTRCATAAQCYFASDVRFE